MCKGGAHANRRGAYAAAYRGGLRPDGLMRIGNALYWPCLMTDHEHENQTCPFGELDLDRGVGLPHFGKTQMQHDTHPEPHWQVTGVSYQQVLLVCITVGSI